MRIYFAIFWFVIGKQTDFILVNYVCFLGIDMDKNELEVTLLFQDFDVSECILAGESFLNFFVIFFSNNPQFAC